MSHDQIKSLIARCIYNAKQDRTIAGILLSLRNALGYANKLKPSPFKGETLSNIFKALNHYRRRAATI